jgi:hypothetical protein
MRTKVIQKDLVSHGSRPLFTQLPRGVFSEVVGERWAVWQMHSPLAGAILAGARARAFPGGEAR